jgi:purine-binding chemotaxis protein CheW
MQEVSESEATNLTVAPAAEQLLTFIVDGEEYGVDILAVQEIRGWSTPMPIPHAPAFIQGVINLRGEVVPIADLRARLGIARLEYGETTVVVVLRAELGGRQRVMGIVVDAMNDVTDVPRSAMRPPPSFQQRSGSELVQRIATLPEKMIMILDVAAVFGGLRLDLTASG